MVFIRACISITTSSSAKIFSNLRVFIPLGSRFLYCHALDHSTTRYSTLHPLLLEIKRGNVSPTFSAPIRVMTVSLPGSFRGFKNRIRGIKSLGGHIMTNLDPDWISYSSHILYMSTILKERSFPNPREMCGQIIDFYSHEQLLE